MYVCMYVCIGEAEKVFLGIEGGSFDWVFDCSIEVKPGQIAQVGAILNPFSLILTNARFMKKESIKLLSLWQGWQ